MLTSEVSQNHHDFLMDTQILSHILAGVGGFVQKGFPGRTLADAGSEIPGLPKIWAMGVLQGTWYLRVYRGHWEAERNGRAGWVVVEQILGGAAGLSGLQ